MAAFNSHDFGPNSAEQDTYNNRTSLTISGISTNPGPVPYSTRYSAAGSAAFLYLQTDRVLVSSGTMTTAANYIIAGTSAPTVTGVTFTATKTYIRLTLSGTLTLGKVYTIKVKDNTFSDGAVFNIGTIIPIFLDYPEVGTGIAETINVGTPVMS